MAYENIDANYVASDPITSVASSSVIQIDLNNAGLWKANYCAARNGNVPLLIGWKCNTEGSGSNYTYAGSATISINGGSYSSFSLANTYLLTTYGSTNREYDSMIYGGTSISAYVYRSVISIPVSALGTEHLTSMSIRYTEGDGSYHTAYSTGTMTPIVFSVNSYDDDMFGNMDNWAAMSYAGSYAGDVPSEGESGYGQLMIINE